MLELLIDRFVLEYRPRRGMSGEARDAAALRFLLLAHHYREAGVETAAAEVAELVSVPPADLLAALAGRRILGRVALIRVCALFRADPMLFGDGVPLAAGRFRVVGCNGCAVSVHDTVSGKNVHVAPPEDFSVPAHDGTPYRPSPGAQHYAAELQGWLNGDPDRHLARLFPDQYTKEHPETCDSPTT
jgi:hypothetical protein